MSSSKMSLLSAAALAVGLLDTVRGEAGSCAFPNEPVGVGYFWDSSCELGMLGCNADGENMECRFCGAGAEISIPCPPSSCHFENDPYVPYYWDPHCELGTPGCWADGIHAQCRFCGEHPYTSVPCPEGAAPPPGAACNFTDEPDTPYYWESGCEMGKHGCNADGQHAQCRFCGAGIYSNIPCPSAQVCEFPEEPAVPFYWDLSCREGGLGCNADGIHAECRFCGKRPFEDVPCPGPVAPPEGVCVWPLQNEPALPHYWDETCEMGKLGCWADGYHAECRFCGAGAFENITCPNTTTSPPTRRLVDIGNLHV